MGLFDWLLTDPTQNDGGFLAKVLLGDKPGGASAAGGAAGSPALTSSYGGLLGESPLVNLLRSGFAGMNAADGYSGFGPQFAAGVKGGSDLMDQRHQQMIDQINALKITQLLEAKSGVPDGDGAAADGGDVPASGGAGVGGSAEPCPTCAGANKAGDPPGIVGSSAHMPVNVSSPQEAAKLPPGTWFRAPDGRVMQRGTVGMFNNG